MIRIDQLPTTIYPSLLHAFAAIKDDATVQLTIQQVADLVKAYLAEDAPETLDTIKEIATALGDNPDVITTLLAEQALRLKRDGSNFADDAEVATFRAALGMSAVDLPFLSVPVGGFIEIPTNLTGVATPDKDSTLYRFARLTAGLTGSGQENEGILVSESVSGSAPLVLATAVVSLTGSPMDGQTIRLLNTEGRFIRPGTSAGTVRADQFQDHQHDSFRTLDGSALPSTNGFYDLMSEGGLVNADVVTGLVTGSTRRGNETYPKHMEVTYYQRIK
jgi:hypothetical protein